MAKSDVLAGKATIHQSFDAQKNDDLVLLRCGPYIDINISDIDSNIERSDMGPNSLIDTLIAKKKLGNYFLIIWHTFKLPRPFSV